MEALLLLAQLLKVLPHNSLVKLNLVLHSFHLKKENLPRALRFKGSRGVPSGRVKFF